MLPVRLILYMSKIQRCCHTMVSAREWWPEKYLISDRIPDQEFALIILNRPLKIDPYFFITLWNKGKISIVCTSISHTHSLHIQHFLE